MIVNGERQTTLDLRCKFRKEPENLLDDGTSICCEVDGLLRAHGIDKLSFVIENLIALIYDITRVLVEEILRVQEGLAYFLSVCREVVNAHQLEGLEVLWLDQHDAPVSPALFVRGCLASSLVPAPAHCR
jgi:hypothetical protein